MKKSEQERDPLEMSDPLDFSIDIDEEITERQDVLIGHRQHEELSESQSLLFIEKKRTLKQCLRRFPRPGEYFHVVNDARYDFYTMLPTIIDRLGTLEECYITTWTMNRNNVVDLLHHIDTGRIKKCTLVTGLYLKRRHTEVYVKLTQGLRNRGHRYLAFKNHCKILMCKPENEEHIVVEGSANFTANPRMEQYIITDNEALYMFHKRWIQEAFNRYSDYE